MKYATATLALLAGLAAAHDNPFGDVIPDCAVDCLIAGIESIGCTVGDTACSCTVEKQTELSTNPELVGCLTSGCSGADLAKAISGGASLCEGAGGDATGTDEPTASETAGAEETSGGAAAPTGGNSTATGVPSPTDASGGPEPSGGQDGGDDQGGDDQSGGDGQDGAEDEAGGEDAPGSAAIPAIFGGAALMAAILAL